MTPEERENLVAYLDRELDDEQTQEVEQFLAREETARRDCDALVRTWDLLDALARPRVTAEFTHRTVASLQSLELPPRVGFAVPWKWIGRGVVLVLWGLVIALWGRSAYQFAKHRLPGNTTRFLDDLPLVDRLPAYQEVGQVDFLEALKRRPPQEETDAPQTP